MKTIILLLSLLVFSEYAFADIVLFETNNFTKKIKLTWRGKLQKIYLNSQVALFTYRNSSNPEPEKYQVHITRIYSLTLDDEDSVNKPFPATLQDLATPLPTDPRFGEQLELTNKNFVGDDIPGAVRVRPDRKSSKLYLSGTIKYGDLQKLVLEAKAENQGKMVFEIGRSDLVKWIRGR
jgi:hypothetical protein